MDVEDEVLL